MLLAHDLKESFHRTHGMKPIAQAIKITPDHKIGYGFLRILNEMHAPVFSKPIQDEMDSVQIKSPGTIFVELDLKS